VRVSVCEYVCMYVCVSVSFANCHSLDSKLLEFQSEASDRVGSGGVGNSCVRCAAASDVFFDLQKLNFPSSSEQCKTNAFFRTLDFCFPPPVGTLFLAHVETLFLTSCRHPEKKVFSPVCSLVI